VIFKIGIIFHNFIIRLLFVMETRRVFWQV